MKLVGEAGQIKVGDTLRIIAKSKKDNYRKIKVKMVVDNGCGNEIIIKKHKNIYFMELMYLSGKSWAKEVYIL